MGEEKQESQEGQKSQEEKEIIDVNLVPEFLEKTIEVKSVPGFLNTIVQINNYKEKLNEEVKEINDEIYEEFKKTIEGKEIFYRGSNNDEYKVMPSVFRDHVEKEHIMFREMLLQNTKEFYNDITTLDKLVRMQHFELPTRLLDVTSNPLTALFFACEEEKEKNAEVIIFIVDKENINYPDSDTVACVSNLARMSYEERERIRKRAEKYEILYYLLNVNSYNQEFLIQKIKKLIKEKTEVEERELSIEKLIKINSKTANMVISLEKLIQDNEKLVEEIDRLVQEKKELIQEIEKSIQEIEKSIQDKERLIKGIASFFKKIKILVKNKEKLVKNKEKLVKNKEKLVKNKEKLVKNKEKLVKNKEKLVKNKEMFFKHKEVFEKKIRELIKRKIKKIISEKKEKIIEIYDDQDLNNEDELSLEKEAKEEVKKELTKIIKKIYSGDFKNAENPTECLIELFNSDEDVKKLIHYIKDERGFFEDRILPKDLNRVICVKSKKDNPRIRAQAGDFLLFGKDEALNKDVSNYDGVQVLTRIIIKPKYKKAIIKQLDKININRGTVYPDMINTAEYIKNKYK